MLKTIGCKIPANLHYKINSILSKTNISKSDFLRMLLEDYFKDQKLNKDVQVNAVNPSVNQLSDEDEYQDTMREVDSLLKELKKDIKKQKSGN